MATIYDTKPREKFGVGKILAYGAAALLGAGAIYYYFIRKVPEPEIDDSELVFNKSNYKKKNASASSSSTSKPKTSSSSPATTGAMTATSSGGGGLQQSGSGGGGGNSSPSSSIGSRSGSGMLEPQASMFGGNTSFAGETAIYRDETDGIVLPGEKDENGRVVFPHLRLTLHLAEEYDVQEEVSPVPASAVVMLNHSKYTPSDPSQMDPRMMMPGEIPMIVISVADTTNDGITLEEHKEKAKEMTIGQLTMMTQGMFPPHLLKDAVADVGHFRYIVEVTLSHPQFQLHAILYFALINNLAYTFQMMAKPDLIRELRPSFAQMVRTAEIAATSAADGDFVFNSFLCLPLGAGVGEGALSNKTNLVDPSRASEFPQGSFRMPPSWGVPKQNGSFDVNSTIPADIIEPSSVLAVVQTPSASKAETIILVNKEPSTTGFSVVGGESNKPLSSGDVTVTEYRNNKSKHMKILKSTSSSEEANSGIFLVTCPISAHHQIISDDLLGQVLSTVDLKTPARVPAGSAGVRYQSTRFQFGFDCRKGGKILESRLGDRVIMYAPLGGLDMNAAAAAMGGSGGGPTEEMIREIQKQPMVSIRVGDPATDPQLCKENLQDWFDSIKSQSNALAAYGGSPDRHSDENAPPRMEDCKKETFGKKRQFVTFTTKEMVEVGAGMKDERVAKMYVTMEGRKSVLVRWEAVTGEFPKFKQMQEEMMDSLDVTD